MQSIPFTKMHGAGNDYVYVDCVTNPSIRDFINVQELSIAVSDRNKGIGSDGLILILPPESGVDADIRMRMFNADGSESEMCGNGIRCVAKLAHDRGLTNAKPMRVQTGAGVLSIDYELSSNGKVEFATVDMGEPILEPARIPVDIHFLSESDKAHSYILELEDKTAFTVSFVSMGNPHAVIYVDELAEQHLQFGPDLENHPAFPNRMNIHFVKVHSRSEVTAVHWERGSGPTLACGTGACAVCVAGVLTGRTDCEILTHLPGGDLLLHWDAALNHVFMTGPAIEVFTGVWHL